MKIAVPAESNSLHAMTDDRFGRAKGFLVYDTDSKAIHWIDNEKNSNAPQGAGLKAAQEIIDSGAQVIVSYDVGPKAFDLLENSSIIIYRLDVKMKVKDAITKTQSGEIKRMNKGE